MFNDKMNINLRFLTFTFRNEHFDKKKVVG